MKSLFFTLLFLTLSACATITSDSEQVLVVTTTPPGALCTLSSSEGNWLVEKTPGTVSVERSFSPLTIDCIHAAAGKGQAIIQSRTRGRSYGNILIGGIPAIVDASTGTGYEYAPSDIQIQLRP